MDKMTVGKVWETFLHTKDFFKSARHITSEKSLSSQFEVDFDVPYIPTRIVMVAGDMPYLVAIILDRRSKS